MHDHSIVRYVLFLVRFLRKLHQMGMFVMKRMGSGCGRLLRPAFVMLFATLTAALSCAQATEKAPANHAADHYYEPLPQDTGAAGLKLMLRKLQTTGRLMQVDAHPDDEDGGMLTLEARGKGVQTLLMTLTRGEGRQNKLGSKLFDGLGVLR